jgi:hypothetical protein
MLIGLGRPTGGSNKNKILLDCALFRRGRQLWELLQRRVLVTPFL